MTECIKCVFSQKQLTVGILGCDIISASFETETKRVNRLTDPKGSSRGQPQVPVYVAGQAYVKTSSTCKPGLLIMHRIFGKANLFERRGK